MRQFRTGRCGCLVVGAIIVALLMVVGIIVAPDSPTRAPSRDESGEGQSPRGGGERYAGYESAKKLIGPLLTSPASADWLWESVASTQIHDGRNYQLWTVTGDLDAMNPMGVPIRHRWEVVIAGQGDKLYPIRAKLDDTIVWGSDGAVEDLRLAD